MSNPAPTPAPAPTNALTDLFGAIQQTADTAAQTAAVEAAVTEDFRPYSDRQQPSEDFVLPVAPATITLHSYQLAAVEALLRFGRGIVGFAPGMGKTIVAQCAVAARVEQGERAVIVVPPSLRTMWLREFNRQFPSVTVSVVSGKTPEAPADDVDVVVVGDSVVSAWTDTLLDWRPTVLVVDEAQRLKNPSTARSMAARDIADELHNRHRLAPESNGAPLVALLTGTLAVGRPDEVWHPARVCGKQVVRTISGADSLQAFQRQWCYMERVHVGGGRSVAKTVGCVDPEGLHEAFRRSAYLRVEREDVLDLPEKVWSTIDLELNGALSTYRRMERDFIQWIGQVKGKEAAERADKAEAVTKLMALWQEAGRAKAKAAAEYIASLVEQGEQVVAMGWHQSAIAELRSALSSISLGDDDVDDEGNVVRRTIRVVEVVGGLSDAQKQDAQDRFRAGKADVLIGNIIAAGTGLNLDTAAHLVFFQLPWTPGDLVQASDRIYRVTQTRRCTIHVLSAADTVDEHLWAVLDSKAKVVDLINAGTTGVSISSTSSDDTIGAVLSDFGWGS